jgi:hypothetical protein
VKGKSSAVAGRRHSKGQARERRGDTTNSPDRPAAGARVGEAALLSQDWQSRTGPGHRASSGHIMRNSKASERNDALRPRAQIPYFMAPGRGYRPDHHLRSMKNVRNSSLRTKSPS